MQRRTPVQEGNTAEEHQQILLAFTGPLAALKHKNTESAASRTQDPRVCQIFCLQKQELSLIEFAKILHEVNYFHSVPCNYVASIFRLGHRQNKTSSCLTQSCWFCGFVTLNLTWACVPSANVAVKQPVVLRRQRHVYQQLFLFCAKSLPQTLIPPRDIHYWN